MLEAILTLSTAIVAAFSVVVAVAFPYLSALECLFIAPSLGLSVSAWIALALKSLPGAGSGISSSVVWGTIAVQSLVAGGSLLWAGPILKRSATRIRAEVRGHWTGLVVLAGLSVWWFYMSHIHYLFRRGSDHIAGGRRVFAWIVSPGKGPRSHATPRFRPPSAASTPTSPST
jgi:hypothetical protein